MAYIGREPSYGAFEKQTLTADGSTVTYTLNYTVGSTSSILVSVAGVIQEPEVAYNLTSGGSQITFTAAPAAIDTVFVIYLGIAFDSGNLLSTGTITGQTELTTVANDDLLLIYDTDAGQLKKIQKSNLDTSLDINGKTDLGTEPASADEFVIYDADAGSIKKVAYSNINPTLSYTNGSATGDGSTQAFTIDSGRTVNDVVVSVNGFLLVPTDDYTISGTTLTFTTAPAASAEIAFRYLPLGGSGTYTNDTATGDGSTQAFTIDSGRSVEDVMVTVNGVILVPATDYTISGTTLTFTTAPAASAEISIRYLRLT
jgi:hypothetical protein